MIRRFILIAALVTISAHAYAADPEPKAQDRLPPDKSEPLKYHIELEAADIAALSQALVELPKRLADPLIAKINAQLAAEEAARQAASKPPEAPKN